MHEQGKSPLNLAAASAAGAALGMKTGRPPLANDADTTPKNEIEPAAGQKAFDSEWKGPYENTNRKD